MDITNDLKQLQVIAINVKEENEILKQEVKKYRLKLRGTVVLNDIKYPYNLVPLLKTSYSLLKIVDS